jgi:hypothetical protein
MEDKTTNIQTARHLAARAVMALRSGFSVQNLSLDNSEAVPSGIVCNWKCERA